MCLSVRECSLLLIHLIPQSGASDTALAALLSEDDARSTTTLPVRADELLSRLRRRDDDDDNNDNDNASGSVRGAVDASASVRAALLSLMTGNVALDAPLARRQ